MLLKIGPIAITVVTDIWQFVFQNTIITFSGKIQLATQLPDDQEIPFVSPTTGSDAKGNPVNLKGTMAVTTSDATILTIVQPDPLTPNVTNSGVIRPVGPLGNAQVIFTETGDTTDPIKVVVEVTVLAGAITLLNPPVLGNLRAVNTAPDPAAPLVAPNPPVIPAPG